MPLLGQNPQTGKTGGLAFPASRALVARTPATTGMFYSHLCLRSTGPWPE